MCINLARNLIDMVAAFHRNSLERKVKESRRLFLFATVTGRPPTWFLASQVLRSICNIIS